MNQPTAHSGLKLARKRWLPWWDGLTAHLYLLFYFFYSVLLPQLLPRSHTKVPKTHTLTFPSRHGCLSVFLQLCWHTGSFVSHVSRSLKWPWTAYGQQYALFWAIVRNIKKQFAGRPIELTRNRSPSITPLVDCYCHWVVGSEGVVGGLDLRR